MSASTVDEARTAWATAGRDDERDKWDDLYSKAVPPPQTSMTIWERHEAGWPACDASEQARYRELDAQHHTDREMGQ